jgi:hypothetical protein
VASGQPITPARPTGHSPLATRPATSAAAPKTADETEETTQTAQEDETTPIGAGADPASLGKPQTFAPEMPDPQVDAAGFWSSAGAALRSIFGPFVNPGRARLQSSRETSRMTDGTLPALATAIPNQSDKIDSPRQSTATAGQPPKVSDQLEEASRKKLASATHEDMAHAAAKVKALLQITDPDHFAARAKEVMGEWDAVTANTLMVPKAADALAPIVGTAYAQGLQRPDTTLENWNPDQPRVPAGSPGGGQFASASDKVAAVRDGKLDEAAYAKVSPETAAKIKAATGIDASGHSHFIDHDAVRHIDRNHGVGNERQPGHEPVTKEDIAKIPDIVANPDSVTAGGKSGRGLTSIIYAKRHNGITHYVEEHWKGEKVLAAKTMWKKSAPGNSATPFGGVSHTSKTSGAKGT